jgi:hypothetical protein
LLLLQCRLDDLRWCRLDDVMTLLHHGHQERRFIVILGLGQIYPLLPWLTAISGPMAGAPAVMTLVVTLRSLLPAVAALVMASNTIRFSCSVTSPGSMASQRFLACSLIFMINAHSV